MSHSNKPRVAVFFGGVSPENEISVITGIQAYNHIDTELYQPFPVYVTREGLMFCGEHIGDIRRYTNQQELLAQSFQVYFYKGQDGTTSLVSYKTRMTLTQGNVPMWQCPIDIAHMCFHGGLGEGGGFQGLLEVYGVPYTGCPIMGSSIGLDKVTMKKVFQASGIAITPYRTILKNQDREQAIKDIRNELTLPVFVKPSRSGSSIGITKVSTWDSLADAIDVAFFFDTSVIVENGFTDAHEYNISLVGRYDGDIECSPIEQVFSQGEILDFENKYMRGGKSTKGAKSSSSTADVASGGMASANRIIPAPLSDRMNRMIQDQARHIFTSLQCVGCVRIDFLVKTDESDCVAIEINTIPGSLSFYLWKEKGVSFQELHNRLFRLAVDYHTQQKCVVDAFRTNVLDGYSQGF